MSEVIDIEGIKTKANRFFDLKADIQKRTEENAECKKTISANNDTIAADKAELKTLSKEIRPVIDGRAFKNAITKTPKPRKRRSSTLKCVEDKSPEPLSTDAENFEIEISDMQFVQVDQIKELMSLTKSESEVDLRVKAEGLLKRELKSITQVTRQEAAAWIILLQSDEDHRK